MEKNFLESLNSLVPITGTNSKGSIYVKSIYEGCISKEDKKKVRNQLRKNRDNFVKSFVSVQTNKTECLKLAKNWKEYASKIYLNSSVIYSSNTDLEERKIIDKFILCMNDVEKFFKK